MEIFDGDYPEGKRVVLDHFPVWAAFRTDVQDNDAVVH